MWFADGGLPGVTDLPQFGLAATLMAIIISLCWWDLKRAEQRNKDDKAEWAAERVRLEARIKDAEARAERCSEEVTRLHRELLEATKVTTPALIEAYRALETVTTEVNLLREQRRGSS